MSLLTLEAVRAVFVELFCRPKSSMENPSLRVSGHVSSMNRICIVEDCPEDDFGQWATDEVTGEQGYIDDERSCFWTWDDTECAWQSRPLRGREEKEKEKEKEKVKEMVKDDPKGREEHYLAMSRYKNPEWWWSEKDFDWWSKEKKGKKDCQKAMMAFRRVVFALTSQTKAQARIIPRTKVEERTKKG